MKFVVSGNTVADRIHKLSFPLSEDGKYVFPSADGTTAEDVAKRLGIDLSSKPDARIPGGQAATPADLLRKLGNEIIFVGPIGNNDDAKFIEKDFKKSGIEISHSPMCKADHFRADVFVGSNSSRVILMYKDPNLICDAVSLDWLAKERPDAIYVDGHEPELALELAKRGKDLGIPVFCDLEDLSKPHDFLAYVDYFIAPKKIILQIGQSNNVWEALRRLAKSFKAVIATDGANGSYGISGSEEVYVKALKVGDHPDTTGCGDTYHAAFMDAKMKGFSFKDSMEIASDLAAYKCNFKGGRIPLEKLRGHVHWRPARTRKPKFNTLRS